MEEKYDASIVREYKVLAAFVYDSLAKEYRVNLQPYKE